MPGQGHGHGNGNFADVVRGVQNRGTTADARSVNDLLDRAWAERAGNANAAPPSQAEIAEVQTLLDNPALSDQFSPELRENLQSFVAGNAPPAQPTASFTAVADICLGWLGALATGTPGERWPIFVALLGSSACLYSAGMVWNDFFDIEQDRRERPFRPLPSGRITRRAAARLAAVLQFVGLAFAVAAGALESARRGAGGGTPRRAGRARSCARTTRARSGRTRRSRGGIPASLVEAASTTRITRTTHGSRANKPAAPHS